MDYAICKGNHTTLGVHVNGNITTFSVRNRSRKECALLLYPKNGGKVERIPMQKDKEKYTSVYSVGLRNLSCEDYDYIYEIAGVPTLDPYARKIVGREKWGDTKRKSEKVKCGINKEERFAWGGDTLPQIPKQDMVIYKLHVRGFSMMQKIPEQEKGTFRGVERKLSYLKELGITTLELMPVYEFEEMFAQDPYQNEVFPEDKINYWGYTGGNYFAVKSSYLGEGNSDKVFRHLICTMHKKGLECILEFNFDNKLNPHFIIEVLRYWATEYHVDGFHVLCSPDIAGLIARDEQLEGRKLFFEWFSEEQCFLDKCGPQLFSYNDAFLYSVRKLMNHYEETIQEFAGNMRRQQRNQGFVNYLASNNGFTLNDMFTYTEKRNHDNGEENRDGITWNFSSNCGQEGISNAKRVNQMRERQMKNALCTLMFAQGVPMIWMGDECGNTQKGNNNAYCQDNEIGWKNWDVNRKSRELISFFKQLTALRRKYPVLRNPMPMELLDYKRIGYPDLSYHGDSGWRMDSESNKSIGMMYACEYMNDAIENKENGKELKENYIYIGYNFSSYVQTLALPVLPKDYRWCFVMNTDNENIFEEQELPIDARSFEMEGMSVCFLVARQKESRGNDICKNKEKVRKASMDLR